VVRVESLPVEEGDAGDGPAEEFEEAGLETRGAVLDESSGAIVAQVVVWAVDLEASF